MKNKDINIERWLTIFVVIIAIVRLVLTSDRDILALNSPHDEFWYVNTACKKIWGGPYNEMSFMHLPIYAIWLGLLYLFGIPARLGIDIAWLSSIGYLAFAIYRLTLKAWLAALAFAFLAFHPYPISIFDRALAETLLTVASAALTGAAIELWTCRDSEPTFRRRFALLVYVAGYAIAYHTRKEGIVLVVPLVLLAFWSWFDRQRWWSGSGKKRLAIPLLVAPVFATILIGTMLAGINYYRWGVFARHELAAPGYQRAIGALNRIDVGRTPKHITVTQEALSRAYRESPTFRELRPYMESWPGKMWLAISSQSMGHPGEIGNGWFYWALRNAAATAGWHCDARFADGKYTAMANEIENAFDAGKLRERGIVPVAFLDPDMGKWMPDVPEGIFEVAKLVVAPHVGSLEAPRENASAGQYDQFARLTGRRAPPPRYDISGWTILPVGTLVGLGSGNTTYSWARLLEPQRPDVPGAYPFSISAINTESASELHFWTPDGRKGSVGLAELSVGKVSTFHGDINAGVGIDILATNSKTHRADRWLAIVCTIYDWMGYVICLLAVAGIAILGIRRKPISAVALVFGLAMAAIGARIGLFGILDASSWSGLQARYMLPIIPAFACVGAMSLSILTDAFGKKLAK